MGSKKGIGRELFEIIKQDSGLDGGNWVEPFVGGANMIQYVQDDMFGSWKRYANDYNKYVVACLKAVADDDWIPPQELSEDEYKKIKDDYKSNGNTYDDQTKGFVGITCTFASKFFDIFARNKNNDNYALRGCNGLLLQKSLIQNINWQSGEYKDMDFPAPEHTIIYCDPPYSNTTDYGTKFDHEAFYQWCRDKKAEGYHIYVSEYNMPDDFELMHTIEVSCDFSKNVNDKETKRFEKLYTLR